MSRHDSSQDDIAARQLRLRGIVFQTAGLFDVALGIGLALFLPDFIGRDPATDLVIWIGGAVIAVFGAGLWWFGRYRLGGGSDPRSGPTVQRIR